MLRRLIAVTALAAGLSVTAAICMATPALAKGPSQASITGPGLVRAVVVSGNGEPGEQGTLAVLAGQTGLFTALFGPGASVPNQTSASLRTPPPKATLGPRYTVIYTVPGVTPKPGVQYGRVRQDLYPSAAGGPVIYTPPGQDGFGMPLQVTGWLRGGPQLTRTLAQLGVPLRPGTRAAPQIRPSAAHPAAPHQPGSRTLTWLIAAAVAIAAAALTGIALQRHPQADHRARQQTQSQRTGRRVCLAGSLAAAKFDASVHDGQVPHRQHGRPSGTHPSPVIAVHNWQIRPRRCVPPSHPLGAPSRVQHRVDRRFNRARYDTVAAFAAPLKDAVNLDSVTDDLAGVAEQALAPAHVSIWINDAGNAGSGTDLPS